jgi:hypothetical protein
MRSLANLLRVRQFTGNRVVSSDNPLLPAQAIA